MDEFKRLIILGLPYNIDNVNLEFIKEIEGHL